MESEAARLDGGSSGGRARASAGDQLHLYKLVITLLGLLLCIAVTAGLYLMHTYGSEFSQYSALHQQATSYQSQAALLGDALISANQTINATRAQLANLQGQLVALENRTNTLAGQAQADNQSLALLTGQVANYSNQITSYRLQVQNLSSNLNMQNIQSVVPYKTFVTQGGNTTRFKIVPTYSGRLVVWVSSPVNFELKLNTTNFAGPIYNETVPPGKYTFTFPVVGAPSGAYSYGLYITDRSTSGGFDTIFVNVSVYN